VIGNVVKSEDIPAATQLFTPNWIVKYLVQNSVGRQWLMTYPDSGLKAQMEYYIEPAEQEPSVVEALAAITPTSIDPETLKVLDPACGSGHILVEAYDILKAIYEERGYRIREIPKLILENNLYGLDIDDRAAQLAGFALMMKAREDDRRIFTRDIKLNVLAIQSTQNLDLPDLWRKLALNQDAKRGSMESIFDDVQSNLADTVDDIEFKQLRSILALFEQAKTLGSLIQVPHDQADYLQNLTSRLQELVEQGDSMQKQAGIALLPYIQQAWLLAEKYDVVVANPPYMGGKGMNVALKEFAKKQFPNSKSDLFAMFIERGFEWCKPNGFNSMVTMQSWMFLSSYEAMREKLLKQRTLSCMVHMGNGVMGIAFGTAATIFTNQHINDYAGSFSYCDKDDLNDNGIPVQFPVKNERLKTAKPDDFKKISGSPIAYWVSNNFFKTFNGRVLGSFIKTEGQNKTADNDQFLRLMWEVSSYDIGVEKKWLQYAKGGAYRKWAGNLEYIVNWSLEARQHYRKDLSCRIIAEQFWYRHGVTWTDITSGGASFRYLPENSTFDMSGPTAFFDKEENPFKYLALLNSNYVSTLLPILNPTMHAQLRDIRSIPVPLNNASLEEGSDIAFRCVAIAQNDWNNYETSWDFTENPLIRQKQNSFKAAFDQWQTQNRAAFAEMQRLEEENNRLFIEAYGLQDELTPEVPEDQITLTRADQEKDIQRLISYAIGCMMGRYSLDEPGLIYAHAGNIDFDATRYQTFPADEDGILPLTDQEWFKDDASNRFREFLLAVWGEDSLQQNLEFVAESLTLSSFKPKKGETSLDTVRRYLSNQFYKDHLQTYKKRPIYWLFSSGKQKAFECLVYLHRYNDSTLARMRTEYVTPLLGKYSAYADQLNQQLQDASSSEATPIKNKIKDLEKKQTELRQFDDKLKHYADMRIKIDLDDGVKVNYGKFGDLLAEVKAVTGGTGD
jgi:type II restriction/modification system DNA methylase subunit YeeA